VSPIELFLLNKKIDRKEKIIKDIYIYNKEKIKIIKKKSIRIPSFKILHAIFSR